MGKDVLHLPRKLKDQEMRFIRGIAVIAILLSVCFHSEGAIIRVPEDAVTIQEAFDQSSISDTILLSNTHYNETVRVPLGLRTLASNFIYSNDQNDISTTIIQPGDTVTSDTSCCLVLMQGCSLEIVGVSFKFGKGVRQSNGRYEGGAIYAESSFLRISDCSFSNCFADFGICIWISGGSALSVYRTRFTTNGRITGSSYPQACIRATDTQLTVGNCRFDNNLVVSAPAIVLTFGSAQILDSVVDSNLTTNSFLPAITADDADLVVRGTIFRENENLHGFANTAISSDTRNVIIEGCSFYSNRGGSVLSLWGDSARVENCLFESNVASIRGTAGISFGYGAYQVSNCTFRDNTAEGWAVLTTNGTTTVADCEFTGNVSQLDSVGLMTSLHDSIILRGCSFQGNTPCAFSTNQWFEGFIDARNCYWGAESGPFHSLLNPDGEGDTILGDDVLFVPWLVNQPNVVKERITPAVSGFEINSVYPNPFNSSVTIEYALTREQVVLLEVFDVLGRKVVTLLHTTQAPGVHAVLWNAEHQATGLYFARLSSSVTAQTSQSVKLLLLK